MLKDPGHIQARILLGDLYLQLGDGYSAENEFRKAVSLGVPRAQLEIQIARSLLLAGQFKKILDEFQPADNNFPPELHALRGEAYLNLKNLALAKTEFDQALQLQPKLSAAQLGQSKLALAGNDVDSALKYVNLATESDPNNSDAWLFKGNILRARSNSDGAMACFDQALKIQPNNFAAHLARANIEIGLKKFDAAQTDIKSATELHPKNPNGVYAQAMLYFYQGKNREALDAASTVLKSAPQFAPAILLSGAVNYALGATEQAEVFLKRYLADLPDNLYARKLLAQSQLKNGKPDLALATLQTALKNGPNEDSQLYALAGEAALRLRDFNQSNAYFEHAAAIAPQNANIHTDIALEKIVSGDNTVAISELEKAISLNDKVSFPKSAILLTMTYMKVNELDKALSTVQRLLKELPDNPIAHNLQGMVYLKKNDIASARTNFEIALREQPTYYAAAANLAQIDVQEKKYKEANERFLGLLKADPANLNAQLALATLANSQGNARETEKWLKKALDDHPRQVQAAQPLIGFYFNAKEPQKALDLARNIQASDPENPATLSLLARTQVLGNDRQGAISSYTKLAALYPESADAQFQVALAYLNAGDDANATGTIKKILLFKPTFAKAQIALADLESRSGKFEPALQIAKQMQTQSPADAQGFMLEGELYMRQNKYGLAAKAYQTAFQIDNNTTLLVKLHSALVKDNNAQLANEKMEDWLKAHPLDTRTRLYYATYLLGDAHSKMPAINQLLVILKSEPDNPMILNNLAWAYDQENSPNAFAYAEKAYQKAAMNPQILDTYGWILAEKGDYAKAIALLQQSIKLMPADSEIHFHLASALLKSGDKVQARKELEQLVKGKVFPSMPAAQKMLRQLAA